MTNHSKNVFGPWHYRGYDIERYHGEDGPVEFIVTKSGGDEIASFGSKRDAQSCIDDMISDANEYHASDVETWSDHR